MLWSRQELTWESNPIIPIFFFKFNHPLEPVQTLCYGIPCSMTDLLNNNRLIFITNAKLPNME